MIDEQRSAQFDRLLGELDLYTTRRRLDFKMSWFLRDVDLRGRRVLDIGSGRGTFGVWCLLNGARELTAIEPEAAGSETTAAAVFRRVVSELDLDARVRLHRVPFQQYDAPDGSVDLIFCHYAINHLDEEACVSLHASVEAWARYVELLRRCHRLLADGGTMVVSDCARRNFWPLVGLGGIPGRSVEWDKHQQPALWCRLFEDAGFRIARSTWTPPYPLRRLGPFARSGALAWFLNSNFTIQAHKPGRAAR